MKHIIRTIASSNWFNYKISLTPTAQITGFQRIKTILTSICFCTLLPLLLFCNQNILAQTNSHHVKVSGYYKSNGTYVQPYFRTAPNTTNRDNFSTKGNTNPYTGKPGWVEPDSKYDKLYYNTYTYSTASEKNKTHANDELILEHKDRAYVEDESGKYTCYLTVKDQRSFNIYDLEDNLILLLVVNHRGDWRIFDNNGIYIKTIFVVTENADN